MDIIKIKEKKYWDEDNMELVNVPKYVKRRMAKVWLDVDEVRRLFHAAQQMDKRYMGAKLTISTLKQLNSVMQAHLCRPKHLEEEDRRVVQ